MIQKYIDKITLQDVYTFAAQNEISLKENEANLIYKHIKSDWEELIFHDHNVILEKNKEKLEPATYEKIKGLITLFKNKYKNYL